MCGIDNRPYQFVIVADTYIPDINSGANQIHDLFCWFNKRYDTFLFSGVSRKVNPIDHTESHNCHLLYNRGKQSSRTTRVFAEFSLQIRLLVRILTSVKFRKRKTVVIVYTPMIFWSILTYTLRAFSGVRIVLIVRDIFPDWMLGTGVLKGHDIRYLFLEFNQKLLFSSAEVILAESSPDGSYLRNKIFNKFKLPVTYEGVSFGGAGGKSIQLGILPNWLYPITTNRSVQSNTSRLRPPVRLLYLGNVGVAQGRQEMDSFLKFIRGTTDFVVDLYCYGSELNRLKEENRACERIIFYEPVSGSGISTIIGQADYGLIFLSESHFTNNVPGKFIEYIRHGLPCLFIGGSKSFLARTIESNNLGYTISVSDLHSKDVEWLKRIGSDEVDWEVKSKACLAFFSSKHGCDSVMLKLTSYIFSDSTVEPL